MNRTSIHTKDSPEVKDLLSGTRRQWIILDILRQWNVDCCRHLAREDEYRMCELRLLERIRANNSVTDVVDIEILWKEWDVKTQDTYPVVFTLFDGSKFKVTIGSQITKL